MWSQSHKGLAFQSDLTFSWPVDSGDQVEYRGFTSPIGADQSSDLPWLDFQVVITDRAQSTKIVGHLIDLQQRHTTPPPLVSFLA